MFKEVYCVIYVADFFNFKVVIYLKLFRTIPWQLFSCLINIDLPWIILQISESVIQLFITSVNIQVIIKDPEADFWSIHSIV